MDAETIVNSLLTAGELVAAILLFATGLPRRNGYIARMAASAIVLAAVIGLYMGRIASAAPAHLFGLISLYAVVLALCCLVVGFCHEATAWTALFCATAGYATQNLASGIVGFANQIGPAPSSELAAYALMNLLETSYMKSSPG